MPHPAVPQLSRVLGMWLRPREIPPLSIVLTLNKQDNLLPNGLDTGTWVSEIANWWQLAFPYLMTYSPWFDNPYFAFQLFNGSMVSPPHLWGPGRRSRSQQKSQQLGRHPPEREQIRWLSLWGGGAMPLSLIHLQFATSQHQPRAWRTFTRRRCNSNWRLASCPPGKGTAARHYSHHRLHNDSWRLQQDSPADSKFMFILYSSPRTWSLSRSTDYSGGETLGVRVSSIHWAIKFLSLVKHVINILDNFQDFTCIFICFKI